MKPLIFILIALLALVVSCHEKPTIFIGLESTSYDWKKNKHVHPNSTAVVYTADSMEGIRLLDIGCIFTPNRRKHKFYTASDQTRYIIHEGDTTVIELEKLSNTLYRSFTSTDGTESTFTPIIDVAMNPECLKLINGIAGSNYTFSLDDIDYSITFYDYECLITYQDETAEYVDIGVSNFTMVGNHLFLAIEGAKREFNFQVVNITDTEILSYCYTTEFEGQVTLNKTAAKPPLASEKNWQSVELKNYSDDSIDELAKHSASARWLINNKKLITSDSINVLDIYHSSSDTVHVDWVNKLVIHDHSKIAHFEILNGQRIELFPTLEDGKVDRSFSKIFYAK